MAARRERDLVTALHLLAAELSSGALPESALRAAAAAGPAYQADLADAADAVRRGDPPDFDTPVLLPLGRAWRVAADTGAPLAGVVERVAGDVTGRIALRRDVTAAVAGARSSAFLLAVLPVLGVLLGTAMQANPVHVLFGSSAGRMLCLAGVLLDACGVAWTHRLAAKAQRT
jgi:tight adherence protein B